MLDALLDNNAVCVEGYGNRYSSPGTSQQSVRSLCMFLKTLGKARSVYAPRR